MADEDRSSAPAEPGSPDLASGSFATRGQDAAVAAVRRMVEAGAVHALLLVGPPSSGKTTLALDLAAGLLCQAPDPASRPCRACRACRQVSAGNHPDLHRLAPEGAGAQIRVGDSAHPEVGTVRHLIGELALLPVEGGARVAIVEAAHRMNEDAQNTLLKTLEEAPVGATLVLCADDEERLLPTVRSRCARIRLGPLGTRDIETLLAERGLADPPLAARLARLAEGLPGRAVAYAARPEAARIREELGRSLVDLLAADRRSRLVAVRELQAAAGSLAEALSASGDTRATPARRGAGRRAPGRGSSGRASAGAAVPIPEARPGDAAAPGTETAPDGAQSDRAASDAASDAATADAQPDAADAALAGRPAAVDRRRAALMLLEVWRFLAVDLALAARGGRRELRDPALLDELAEAGRLVPAGAADAFLARLDRTGQLIEQNVSPELALDVLALAWPHVG